MPSYIKSHPKHILIFHSSLISFTTSISMLNPTIGVYHTPYPSMQSSPSKPSPPSSSPSPCRSHGRLSQATQTGRRPTGYSSPLTACGPCYAAVTFTEAQGTNVARLPGAWAAHSSHPQMVSAPTARSYAESMRARPCAVESAADPADYETARAWSDEAWSEVARARRIKKSK